MILLQLLLQKLMTISPQSELDITPAELSVASKALQSKLLEKINSLSSKEELLAYVEQCHHLLDTINLATVLYRLARLYSFVQITEQKAAWRRELMDHPVFTILLQVIQTHLVQAQTLLLSQPQVPGINARCMSNLLWSLVKLEVTSEVDHDSGRLAVEVALISAPLVMHYLPESTGQGLGNMLWSYAKITSAPSAVLVGIVTRMVDVLENCRSPSVLDAQALSNTLWSIAHLRTPQHEVDSLPEWQDAVTSFLLLATNHCINLLTSFGAQQAQGLASTLAEGHFSYQAMVNVAWSFSAILGSACGIQEPLRTLFLLIRQRAVTRLQAMASSAATGRPPQHILPGSFNEQALSHLVQAYDEAQLLDSELLQAVFDVASLRLGRASNGAHGPLGFKPEELGILLRAVHKGIAAPRAFLAALSRLLAQYPEATTAWPPEEQLALQQALQLLPSLPVAPPPPMRIATNATHLTINNGATAAQYIPAGAAAPALFATSAPVAVAAAPAPTMYATAAHHALRRQNTSSSSSASLYSARSAPQPAYHQLLDLDPLASSASSDVMSQERSSRQMSPAITSMAPQAANAVPPGYVLQQVWVVNRDGMLQPINLLCAPQGNNGEVVLQPGNAGFAHHGAYM